MSHDLNPSVQPWPGRPPIAELARRLRTVLRIATEMFIERGYVETTIVAVAAAARVNPHTVARHFGDKGELFKVVLRQSALAIPAFKLRRARETVFDFYRRLAQHVLREALHPQSIGLLRLLISESSRFPDITATTMAELEARRLGVIVEAITAAADLNMLLEPEALRTAKLFKSVVVGCGPLEACLVDGQPRMSAADLDERVLIFFRAHAEVSVDERSLESESYPI